MHNQEEDADKRYMSAGDVLALEFSSSSQTLRQHVQTCNQVKWIDNIKTGGSLMLLAFCLFTGQPCIAFLLIPRNQPAFWCLGNLAARVNQQQL